MSETDSFIEEVTEAVRQDKLFAAFKKWGWIGGVVILAIVGGTAWNAWQKEQAQNTARAFGDQVMAAIDAKDTDAELAKITPEGPGRTAVLALMRGDAELEAGKDEEALKQFEAVGAQTGLPRSISDLAKLKAVIAAGDKMDAAKRDATLQELAQPGAPYRLLAMEQQAVASLAKGDRDGALAMAKQILEDAGLTPGLQQRATELIVALGGELPSVPGQTGQAPQQ
ncbi:tetratricopeptide repeat protein [Thioclava atlantica]|uniref:Ancillary SecYEG translocon subunit/Cell division coordinator CpoB TPR domain-containing protein n=1 Tax=Thioclava atlantica TaxID=1317124 RepID=A0A085U1X1_9RHOB|nr:tetratricopeptide repeat protein [Thioclava atlantica]KFE36968.1 hypothetical protein DW2_02380 [Thioclava atlantica]